MGLPEKKVSFHECLHYTQLLELLQNLVAVLFWQNLSRNSHMGLPETRVLLIHGCLDYTEPLIAYCKILLHCVVEKSLKKFMHGFAIHHPCMLGL
jgi:hypothetical protein